MTKMSEQSHTALPPEEDEIDLAELLAKLWRGRWLITGVTAAGIGLAAAYAYTAKEEWTSRATIVQPQAEELGDYYQAQQQLWRIQNDTGEQLLDEKGNLIQQKPRLTLDEVSNKVFNATQTEMASADARRRFWQGTAYYRQRAAELSPQAQARLLEQLSLEDITVSPPDGKKQLYHQVQLTADSPDAARKLLQDYLNSVNTGVWKDKAREYQVASNTLKLDLQDEKQSLAQQQQARNRSLLDSTQRARDTAARGGIDTFKGSSYQTVEKPEMLFLLGTRSLQARIDTLKQGQPVYPVRYYQLENRLQQINLLPALKGSKQSFHYLEAPTLPVQRDKPKRSLIVALGAVGGLLLGCLWVLGRDALAGLRDKLKD